MSGSRDGKALGNAEIAVTKLEEKISSCQTVTQSGLRPFTACSVLPLSNFFTHGIVTLLNIFHLSRIVNRLNHQELDRNIGSISEFLQVHFHFG